MKKLNIIASTIFASIELVLLILIETLNDLQVIPILQYISIGLCLSFSLIFIKADKFNLFISIGLLLTLGADTFLVIIRPQNKLAGMIFFLASQIVYCGYLMLKNKNKKVNIINLSIRIVGSILISIIASLVLKDAFDALSLVSSVYIFNELVNIVFSFFTFGENKLFSIGFVLFFVCDIFIGLSVANGVYLQISSSLASAISNGLLAWAFYVPSQTLIALNTSLRLKKDEANNENS